MAAERKKVLTGAVTEEDVIIIRDLVKVSYKSWLFVHMHIHIHEYDIFCVQLLLHSVCYASLLTSFQIYGRRLDGCSLRPAKLAVQGISLTVPGAECFGLLGVNGNACLQHTCTYV